MPDNDKEFLELLLSRRECPPHELLGLKNRKAIPHQIEQAFKERIGLLSKIMGVPQYARYVPGWEAQVRKARQDLLEGKTQKAPATASDRFEGVAESPTKPSDEPETMAAEDEPDEPGEPEQPQYDPMEQRRAAFRQKVLDRIFEVGLLSQKHIEDAGELGEKVGIPDRDVRRFIKDLEHQRRFSPITLLVEENLKDNVLGRAVERKILLLAEESGLPRGEVEKIITDCLEENSAERMESPSENGKNFRSQAVSRLKSSGASAQAVRAIERLGKASGASEEEWRPIFDDLICAFRLPDELPPPEPPSLDDEEELFQEDIQESLEPEPAPEPSEFSEESSEEDKESASFQDESNHRQKTYWMIGIGAAALLFVGILIAVFGPPKSEPPEDSTNEVVDTDPRVADVNGGASTGTTKSDTSGLTDADMPALPPAMGGGSDSSIDVVSSEAGAVHLKEALGLMNQSLDKIGKAEVSTVDAAKDICILSFARSFGLAVWTRNAGKSTYWFNRLSKVIKSRDAHAAIQTMKLDWAGETPEGEDPIFQVFRHIIYSSGDVAAALGGTAPEKPIDSPRLDDQFYEVASNITDGYRKFFLKSNSEAAKIEPAIQKEIQDKDDILDRLLSRSNLQKICNRQYRAVDWLALWSRIYRREARADAAVILEELDQEDRSASHPFEQLRAGLRAEVRLLVMILEETK